MNNLNMGDLTGKRMIQFRNKHPAGVETIVFVEKVRKVTDKAICFELDQPNGFHPVTENCIWLPKASLFHSKRQSDLLTVAEFMEMDLNSNNYVAWKAFAHAAV